MQGSVWGNLKCTSAMDSLNKIILGKKNLQYKHKDDSDIKIGVLGMVDDTLSISECGNDSLQKNAVINSFVETRRLTLSSDKSVVLHVGNARKCLNGCPTLKVHKDVMHVTEKVKYLGNLLTPQGELHATIDDRRKRGWRKIAQILGILSEMKTGYHRV